MRRIALEQKLERERAHALAAGGGEFAFRLRLAERSVEGDLPITVSDARIGSGVLQLDLDEYGTVSGTLTAAGRTVTMFGRLKIETAAFPADDVRGVLTSWRRTRTIRRCRFR